MVWFNLRILLLIFEMAIDCMCCSYLFETATWDSQKQ